MGDVVSSPSPDPPTSAGLVVLAFHRVVHHPERDHDVDWDSFRFVLDRIDPSELVDSLDVDPATFGGVRVALTFDDGTQDHAEVALELENRGMKGMFFVPAAKVGLKASIDVAQLRSMAGRGHVIGSHGLTHAPLDAMPREDMVDEVRRSKELLEDLLGLPVDLFAPPGGIYAVGLEAILEDHGFVAARSMIWGVHRSSRDRWRIPSVPATSFVLRRGWLLRTMETGQMPGPMRWAWRAKELLPLRFRVGIRGAIHGSRRSRR